MHPSLERLLKTLAPVPVGDHVYEMHSPREMGAHLFGGQVLAQGLAAAHREAGPELAHSLHAYFLRRGTPQEPVRYEVRTLRASRSFHAIEVLALQQGAPILQMTVSYHHAEPGPVHQIPMDAVGSPGGEGYERALLRVMTPAGAEDPETDFALPVEIRSVGDLGMFSTRVSSPHARCWMRVRGELPEDPRLHQCLFAYASDYAIMAPTLSPHPQTVTDFQAASLDHALWFHRPFRMDQWLLFELDSPVARDGRGLGRGLLYTQEGELVGSCVQEGLVRPVAGSGS